MKNSSAKNFQTFECLCAATRTMQYAAHRFLRTLYSIENALHSGTEFCTFNPFVVVSTPAGPTTHKVKTPCARVLGVFLWAFETLRTRCQHFVLTLRLHQK
ncbi:MAG: hypothetical protein ACOYB2_19860 [Limnohabitans sp.]